MQHEYISSSSSDEDVQEVKPSSSQTVKNSDSTNNKKISDKNKIMDFQDITKMKEYKSANKENVLSESETSEDESETLKAIQQSVKKDLTLPASDIGSKFINMYSASKAQPFTVPASGLSKAKSAKSGTQQERRKSNTSEESDGRGIEFIIYLIILDHSHFAIANATS